MRYFFHIGYHGSRYNGWQKHPGAVTVQEVIEIAMSRVLKKPVAIIGCGRTDAGVHAIQFFFHADLEPYWDFDLLFRLNKILPDDIAIFDIIPMEGLPHCRFDGILRTYDYFMHPYKDPFLGKYSAYYAIRNLNLEKMKAATALLPKYKDYRAFCTSPDRNEHTICLVSAATLYADSSGDKFRFSISSNRFLSKMIRIIMGRLLEIGQGKLSVDEFEYHLANKITPAVIIPAYPQGLYLSKVTYPYLDLVPRTNFSGILQNSTDEYWQPI